MTRRTDRNRGTVAADRLTCIHNRRPSAGEPHDGFVGLIRVSTSVWMSSGETRDLECLVCIHHLSLNRSEL